MSGAPQEGTAKVAHTDVARVAWTRLHAVVFGATLAVLAAVPWTVRHWPSQDGQNHLAVAHILMHYGDPGSPFPQYLDIETGLRPSTVIYAILGWLGRAMPLQTAEKLLVSLAIVLLPASLLLLVRRALPERSANVLLALPFAVGWALAMGFLSFLLGMGFGVVTLALGWDAPPPTAGESRGARPLRLHHALAAVAYLLCVAFHPAAAVITALAFALLEWRNLFRTAEWPRILLVMAPGALYLVASYVAAGAAAPGQQSATAPVETHFADPLTLIAGLFDYHLAYSLWELVPRLAAVVLLVRFAYRGIRTYSPFGSTPEGAVARVVLCFVLLYCVTPMALHGWFYASTRFLLFASLLLPAVAEIPARIGRRLPVVAPALAAAVLAFQWPDIRSSSQAMQDILDVGASIPRGAKIVPMDFTARLFGPQPLGHAWAELVVAHDAIASQIFAAGKPRMGGERFRTLTLHPGVLDEAHGQLPWSTYETWYDVVRKCGKNPLIAWLAFGASGGCATLLAERKATLDAVIDRYDYVLMLDPPDYGRDLIAPHLEIVDTKGLAWLYRVVKP
jgi:hypothetical protein